MINIDKAFITCTGITVDKGITTPDLDTALVMKNIIHASNEKILMCDSSKMGRVSFAQVMELSEVDELITDSGIEQEDLEAFRNITSVTLA